MEIRFLAFSAQLLSMIRNLRFYRNVRLLNNFHHILFFSTGLTFFTPLKAFKFFIDFHGIRIKHFIIDQMDTIPYLYPTFHFLVNVRTKYNVLCCNIALLLLLSIPFGIPRYQSRVTTRNF